MDLGSYGLEKNEGRVEVINERGELEIFNRVYNYLEERRERVLSGKINCIPWGLERFEKEIPGIEQGKFYGITGSQKSAKSQLTNALFLFNPIKFAIDNPGKLRFKIFYFTLEMSVEQIYMQYISHLLYTISKGEIRISPKDLRSTSSANPLDESILEVIKGDEYMKHLKYLEEHVTFIDSIRNPTGIFKTMRDYASNSGTQYKKIIDIIDKSTGEVVDKLEVDDYYQPDDPEEYVIFIIDHVSLLTPESGMSLRESIVKLTSDYCVKLRNKYRYIPVVIQQQSADMESLENIKASKLRPSAAGLAESKTTARDFDYLMGIFSPARHELPTYHGYDITKFQDNIRFMEIVLGREGGGGSLYPLYFDGAVNFFRELPMPDDKKGLEKVYNIINEL